MATKFFLIFVSCVLPFRTLASTTAAQGVTTLTSIPLVQSCSSVSSMNEALDECFTREGLMVEVPTLSLTDGRQAKQSHLDAVMTDSNNHQKVCSKLDLYQRALACAFQVPQQCLTTDYWNYLPNPGNIPSILTMLCDNINVTDVDCAKSAASELYDCGYNKAISYGLNKGLSITTKGILCYAWEANVECLLTVLTPCGCPTTRLYVEISKLYLTPPACSPINVVTPECQP